MTSNITATGAGISGGSSIRLAEDADPSPVNETVSTGASVPRWMDQQHCGDRRRHYVSEPKTRRLLQRILRLVMSGPANPTTGITLAEPAVTIGGDVVMAEGDLLIRAKGERRERHLLVRHSVDDA